MLSFLYRLAVRFEGEHGYRPNLLYLNARHYAQLKCELTAIRDLGPISRFLGMEIILTDEHAHPRMARSATGAEQAAAI